MMFRVSSFLCCIEPVAGGLLLGYFQFGTGVFGLAATAIATLHVMARYPRLLYFVLFVTALLFFFLWSVCSWSLIKGASYREARKIRRFKCFTFFCLVVKFIVLVAALCTIYELDIVRQRRQENLDVALFAVSHCMIASLLWEFYVLIFAHSLEMSFADEEQQRAPYKPYNNVIKV